MPCERIQTFKEYIDLEILPFVQPYKLSPSVEVLELDSIVTP